MDRSGPVPIRVFESGAILVHLAEKFGALLPSTTVAIFASGALALLRLGERVARATMR